MAVNLANIMAVSAADVLSSQQLLNNFLATAPVVNEQEPLHANGVPPNFVNLGKFTSALVERNLDHNRNQLKYFITADFLSFPEDLPVERITDALNGDFCKYADLPEWLTFGKTLSGNFTMDLALLSHAAWGPRILCVKVFRQVGGAWTGSEVRQVLRPESKLYLLNLHGCHNRYTKVLREPLPRPTATEFCSKLQEPQGKEPWLGKIEKGNHRGNIPSRREAYMPARSPTHMDAQTKLNDLMVRV